MGVVSVPGMALERRTLRRRGIIAVVVIVAILLVAWIVRAVWPKDDFTLTLRTPSVAAGIISGAPVRIGGIQVGQVNEVKRLGNGQQGVVLVMNGSESKGLTNNLQADFSAGNLFGVSEVILTPHDGGGALRNGASISPTRTITDNTVSNIITTIGDLQSEAIRPNGATILTNFDASSKALMPVFTALGTVAQAVQDTQRLSTSETFPTLARTIAQSDGAIGEILPALRTLFENPKIHDPNWKANAAATYSALTNKQDSLTAALEKILNEPALNGLRTATPLLVSTLQPILGAFPNGSATGVGIQIGQLLDNVRAAMPNTPNGTVLNARISVDLPAVAGMLPPAPEFQYVPPTAGAPTTSTNQAAKPSTAAPSSASPTTQKPGS